MVVGANYSYADAGVRRGKMHKYKIEIVHATGGNSWSSVVKLRIPKP